MDVVIKPGLVNAVFSNCFGFTYRLILAIRQSKYNQTRPAKTRAASSIKSWKRRFGSIRFSACLFSLQ